MHARPLIGYTGVTVVLLAALARLGRFSEPGGDAPAGLLPYLATRRIRMGARPLPAPEPARATLRRSLTLLGDALAGPCLWWTALLLGSGADGRRGGGGRRGVRRIRGPACRPRARARPAAPVLRRGLGRPPGRARARDAGPGPGGAAPRDRRDRRAGGARGAMAVRSRAGARAPRGGLPALCRQRGHRRALRLPSFPALLALLLGSALALVAWAAVRGEALGPLGRWLGGAAYAAVDGGPHRVPPLPGGAARAVRRRDGRLDAVLAVLAISLRRQRLGRVPRQRGLDGGRCSGPR
jgi:hypothetical protein